MGPMLGSPPWLERYALLSEGLPFESAHDEVQLELHVMSHESG